MESSRGLIGRVAHYMLTPREAPKPPAELTEIVVVPGGAVTPDAADLQGRVSEGPVSSASSQVYGLAENKALSDFLGMNADQQARALQDVSQGAQIRFAILRADQREIVNGAMGHTLFLELLSSSAAPVRQLAKLCIGRGADVEAVSVSGAGALMYAFYWDDVPLARCFLAEGHSITHKDHFGHTPLDRLFNGQFSIAVVGHLLGQGVDLTKLKTSKSEPVWLTAVLAVHEMQPPREEVAMQIMAQKPDFSDAITGGTLLDILNGRQWSPLSQRLAIQMALAVAPLKMAEPHFSSIEKMIPPLLGKQILSKDEEAFLAKLLASEWATFEVRSSDHQPVRSLIGAVRSRPDISDTLKKAGDWVGDDEVVSALDRLIFLKEETRGQEASIFAQFQLLEEIEKPLKVLEAKQFSHAVEWRSGMGYAVLEPIRARLTRLSNFVERVKKQPSLLDNARASLGADMCHLLPYLAMKGEADLYVVAARKEAMNSTHWMSKMLFHALLDKAHIEGAQDYKSSFQADAAAEFAALLERSLKGSWGPWEKELADLKQSLVTETLPLATHFARLAEGEPLAGRGEYYGKEVVAKIGSLKAGEQILIPAGTHSHAVAILIRRTSESEVSLTLFNTGSGLTSAYRLKGTNKYQTFMEKVDVPLKDALTEEKWSQLFNLKASADAMFPVYNTLFEEIGKRGTFSPLSTDLEDFEEVQREGTCAFQSLMAFLRHQVMEKVVGTKEEKYAAYKLVKSELLLPYATIYRSQARLEIRQALETPMEKMGAEQILARMAQGPEAYQRASQAFQQHLLEAGEEKLASRLAQAERPLERYALLRKASKARVTHLIKSRQPPTEFGEHEVLAKARLVHQGTIIGRHYQEISDSEDYELSPEELGQAIAKAIYASPLHAVGIDLAVRSLRPDKDPSREGLNEVIAALQYHAPERLPELASAYGDAGLPKLAQFVKERAKQ